MSSGLLGEYVARTPARSNGGTEGVRAQPE